MNFNVFNKLGLKCLQRANTQRAEEVKDGQKEEEAAAAAE
jgi:hypothetical protein